MRTGRLFRVLGWRSGVDCPGTRADADAVDTALGWKDCITARSPHEAAVRRRPQNASYLPASCRVQLSKALPRRLRSAHLLPKARLFPDLPVWKRHKDSCSKTILNQGLHYNGFILVPPKSRLKESFCEHIKRKQHLYVDHANHNRPLYNHGGIKRVHVVPIDRDPYNITDYAMKTIKAGKVDYDTTIILPRTMSEMKSNTLVLDAKSRALKDIQAETNVSDQMAEIIYSNL
jgi:hypothetical protein